MASDRIFIAYRHADEAHARAIYEGLKDTYGEGRVFRDFDDSSWNTVSELREIVRGCAAVIAIVGPGWISRIDDLSSEGDPLAAELRTAMDTKTILTIPVLVGGADMPKASILPDDLKDFADHRGVPIYPQYVDAGLENLLERLATRVPVATPEEKRFVSTSKLQDRDSTTSFRFKTSLIWVLPLFALLIAGYLYFQTPDEPDPPSTPEFAKLDEADMLALTLQYRFEDYSNEVKAGLASVIINRVEDAEFPNSVKAVLQQPQHFPLWENSASDINTIWQKAQSQQDFATILAIAKRAVARRLKDQTKGATHAAPCDSVPEWMNTADYALSAQIESMCFFIENDQNDPGFTDPIWLPFLREQVADWKTRLIDETTQAGAKRVGEYFEAAGLPASTDATSNGWSAAFVAYVMEKHDFSPPRNAARADSWLTFDLPLRAPRPGAIVLMRGRSNGTVQHIGFYTGTNADGSQIRVIGGNQGNSVSERTFSAANVLGYRWPRGAE